MTYYIVTLKYKPDKKHDPLRKKTGTCKLSEFCTDKTGAHHCIVVQSNNITDVMEFYNGKHITRIEKARFMRIS
jgi:hypothetical protein